MRLSDRERERCFDELARHAAAGRLDLVELERRVALVEGAATHDEALSAFSDLPSAPLGPGSSARDDPGDAGARPRRGRGHGEVETPHPDWQPTPERFRDPRSRRVMRVWIGSDGARHYVPEG